MARKGMELHDRLADLLDRLSDRRPAHHQKWDRELLMGGEWGLLTEGLVAGLVKGRIPITPEEYAAICEVLSIFNLPVRHGKYVNNRDEAIAGLVVREALPVGSPFAIIAGGLPGFEAFSTVSDETLRELESIEYERPSFPARSFDWLLLPWANGVLDMEINATRSPDAWNARKIGDLTYLLGIRDAIESLLPELSDGIRPAVDSWLAEYDRLYTSFTVDNTDRWVAWKGRRVKDGLNWWWYRIPPSGPVAEEHRAYIAGFEEWQRKRAAETATKEGD
ncbi:hypothetical protein [Nocardia sp. CS682]|uniref:hypothetical protein n=1 Tax=Nocardia sp. CS682 TaxID=1047172 RepID=UPI0010751782|nr:hypothetical protein [Nocardia sp. CS682]